MAGGMTSIDLGNDSPNLTRKGSSASDTLGLVEKLGKTYQVTKQRLLERFGHVQESSERPEILQKIAQLEAMHEEYTSLLSYCKRSLFQTTGLLETFKEMGRMFGESSVRENNSSQLCQLQKFGGESHYAIHRNGQKLIAALEELVQTISSFRDIAISDTELSVEKYQEVRLEYDAARSKLASLEDAATKKPVPPPQMEKAQRDAAVLERRFVDTSIGILEKIVVLNEKRVREMHSHVAKYLRALSVWFGECNTELQRGNSLLADIHSSDDLTSLEFKAVILRESPRDALLASGDLEKEESINAAAPASEAAAPTGEDVGSGEQEQQEQDDVEL